MKRAVILRDKQDKERREGRAVYSLFHDMSLLSRVALTAGPTSRLPATQETRLDTIRVLLLQACVTLHSFYFTPPDL